MTPSTEPGPSVRRNDAAAAGAAVGAYNFTATIERAVSGF